MPSVQTIGNCMIRSATRKKRMICINDTCTQEEFEEAKPKVIECFEHILPEKSSFEL